MAIEVTPLGFQKPDGNELVRNGDNAIAINAQKAQDHIGKARADIVNLQSAAGFDGDPLVMQDAVVAGLVGSDSETSAAIELLAEPIAAAAVAPIAAEVSTKASTDVVTATSSRSFTVTTVPAAGGLPAHTIVKFFNGVLSPTVRRIVSGDSTTTTPPRETLNSYHQRTGASALFNASGWWASDNIIMGLSIHNGVLIKGWDTLSSDLGKEAIVFMRDGSVRVYSNSTSPAQIIADGGWNSFSWGAAAYKNGELTNFQNIWRYSESSGQITGRQLVGDTLDGSLICITIPGKTDISGATGQNIVDITAGLGLNNLYILDGGGSAQTMINGQYVVPSADGTERPVPDAIAFYAPDATNRRLGSDWTNIPLSAAYAAQSTFIPQMKIQDGIAYFRGAVKPVAGGTFPVGSAIILTPSIAKLVGIEPMDATVTAWGQTNSGPIRLWIQAGTIQMYVPTGGAVNYVGLAALSGTVLPSS